MWRVYIVRCSDGSLYTGITNDVDLRVEAHNHGFGAKYTHSRRPVELVCFTDRLTHSKALKLEYRVKRLPRASKVPFLTGFNAPSGSQDAPESLR